MKAKNSLGVRFQRPGGSFFVLNLSPLTSSIPDDVLRHLQKKNAIHEKYAKYISAYFSQSILENLPHEVQILKYAFSSNIHTGQRFYSTYMSDD